MSADPTATSLRFVPPAALDAGWLSGRRPGPGDAGDLFEAVTASAGHLRPWMAWASGYTREAAAGFVERNAPAPTEGPVCDVAYLFRDRRGRLLGVFGLHAGARHREIGYWVDGRHTRRGVATLASAALTEMAVQLPAAEAVEIRHDRDNTASGAVPARLGYERRATVDTTAEAPGESGVEWRWTMTARAWPTSAGAQLLAAARLPGAASRMS